MMKAGRDTGSVMNHLMSYGAGPAPEVGMGATLLGWTDRQAATVVWVGTLGKIPALRVQVDTAQRVDQNGMSESQTYSYTPNPQGQQVTFRLRGDAWEPTYQNDAGRWVKAGSPGLSLGHRRQYHDYSF